MQYIVATAALAATAAASSLSHRDVVYEFNSSCNTAEPYAKVVNRCSYPVYLWSIEKQMGCPEGEGLELKPGQFYNENYQKTTDAGISIKLSKKTTCGGKEITQLEYFIENKSKEYAGNYLDMSFVDCLGDLTKCPGRTDGFYLKSGNNDEINVSSVNNEHCPIFSVNNAAEAAKVSYIDAYDPQTKYCPATESLELYLCGGEAPSAGDSYATPASSAAASSSQAKSSSAAEASSAAEPSSEASSPAPAPSSTADDEYAVAAAAVTPAAAIEDANVATALVVVTETVWVDAPVKRSRHAHGRRHQHYHA